MLDQALHDAVTAMIAEHPDWQNGQRLGANKWLRRERAEVYIRLGSVRMINGRRMRTLDVANVIVQPDYRGQHILTNLLRFLESHKVPLFIENVLAPRLAEFFERQPGYQRYTDGILVDYPRLYYRLP